MSLKDTMLADLLTIESDFDDPIFIWKGEEYKCVPSSVQKVKVLDAGGFMVNTDLILTVRLDQFSEVFPEPQQTITYLDKGFRIIGVNTIGVAGSYIRLFCEQLARGV